MKLTLFLVLGLAAGIPLAASAAVPEHLACNLNALNAREQGRHETLVKQLMPKAKVVEQEDGYVLTWTDDPSAYGKLIEFVGYERRCCPFLNFELRFSGPADPVSLTLHGTAEAKALIKETGLFEGNP